MGASKSDAVRDIYIGTLDAFPAQNFPPADYIALGHIHRAQIIGGMEHVRYCGSPIPLSFDECGKSKYVHLVTFSNGKLESVENLNVPVTQPMAVLKGDLASITAQLEQWRDVSQEPPVWLDIEITTDEYLHDIQRKIQALTESLPVEVLLVRRSREQRERVLAANSVKPSANSASKRCSIAVWHWKNWMNRSSNVCSIFSPRRCIPSPENTKHENSQPAPEKPELIKRRMED